MTFYIPVPIIVIAAFLAGVVAGAITMFALGLRIGHQIDEARRRLMERRGG